MKPEDLGLKDSVKNQILIDGSIQWIKDNTTLDLSDLNAVPDIAKLFVLKYVELMGDFTAVTSESLGGMSQSFRNDAPDVWKLAKSLLSPYLKSTARVWQGKGRFTYGGKTSD